jgi:adenylyltransferase/sulfurtransferase
MEGFCGHISVFNDNAHYVRFRDLWPEESIDTQLNIPAIGVTAGVIGSLQAVEVIKNICHIDNRLAGKLLTIDLLNMNFQLIEL